MTDKVYHWLDDSGAWQLARKVQVGLEMPSGSSRRSTELRDKFGKWHILCQHLYSSRLEWVPESKLLPYPSAKIEEPTK